MSLLNPNTSLRSCSCNWDGTREVKSRDKDIYDHDSELVAYWLRAVQTILFSVANTTWNQRKKKKGCLNVIIRVGITIHLKYQFNNIFKKHKMNQRQISFICLILKRERNVIWKVNCLLALLTFLQFISSYMYSSK